MSLPTHVISLMNSVVDVASLMPEVEVWLFGSATNGGSKYSDVDVAFVFPAGRSLVQVRSTLMRRFAGSRVDYAGEYVKAPKRQPTDKPPHFVLATRSDEHLPIYAAIQSGIRYWTGHAA
ncbi:MAG: nucleotidyltransferase domain-containing protein [Planctomycetota bacterium]